MGMTIPGGTAPTSRPQADGPCCSACGRVVPRPEWKAAWVWVAPGGAVCCAHARCFDVFEQISGSTVLWDGAL